MENNPVSVIHKDFIRSLLKKGKREDGRAFDEMRELKIEVGYVPRANGSAFVQLGNTKVIAGVKTQVDTPYPDSGNRGNFMTSAEFAIMASPYFEQGPPRIEAIEVARVTDRALRESGIIDMADLVIKENEKVWGVFVDMEVLDYDGNLFDACSIAALAAVMSGTLPATCPKTGYKASKEDKPLPLKMENATFNTTFAKIDGHILTDPSLYEELICDTRCTMGVDPDGAVRGAQKGGFGAFTVEEVKELRRKAFAVHKTVFAQIEAAVKAAA
jgi:exosome complex component RRP42